MKFTININSFERNDPIFSQITSQNVHSRRIKKEHKFPTAALRFPSAKVPPPNPHKFPNPTSPSGNCVVNESILTGESTPQIKDSLQQFSCSMVHKGQ